MKRILITGANSYIGTSFENWLKQYPNKYFVETVDMDGDAWRAKSFEGFDSVFHVAESLILKRQKRTLISIIK